MDSKASVSNNQVSVNLDGTLPPAGIPKRLRNSGWWYTWMAFLVLVAGAAYLNATVSSRQAALFLVGAFGGLALYHAHFGFTFAWRNFLLDRRGKGIRAQMFMMVVGSLLFFPLLTAGTFAGHPVMGYVSPVGMSLLFGAFLFGIGMQLGDGCASGTLYHIGGGDLRGLVTLFGFIGGSVLGAKDFQWWMNTPHVNPVSFLKTFGIWQGVALQIAIAGFVVWVSLFLERRRHGRLIVNDAAPRKGWKVIYQGPWPILLGGMMLAAVNFAILALSGKPWGVTFAFALWGSKAAMAAGIPIDNWPYWQTAANAKALHGSIFQDVTSILDISIMLGALLAAGLAGRFARPLQWRFPVRSTIGALIGGIMMGYGARIAFGCNIGAYFSGIISFSLHGWIWFIAAFAGTMIGVKLRPLFSYQNCVK